MVEQKPSKLMTRVRFPSPAPKELRRHARENAVECVPPENMNRRPCSSVAEHSLGKGEVARSIRAMGTRIRPRFATQGLGSSTHFLAVESGVRNEGSALGHGSVASPITEQRDGKG